MKKDLLTLYDLEQADFDTIFKRTDVLKRMHKEGELHMPLKGKTLGMIFDKASTRTRISFEVGMFQLGGTALFLSSRDIQLGRGETIADTARVMSRYLDGIVIRTFSQESVEEFARCADIPVINGLTDTQHPCQILSDLYTIRESKGTCEGLKIAYIGDGNNVANSWLDAAAILPFEFSLACPEGYDPDASIFAQSLRAAGSRVTLFRNPHDAAAQADVIYTDVWASMGQEAQKVKRAEEFNGYQVNRELLAYAKEDAIIMHCLPAYRGEEITSEMMDSPRSVIIDQAENRLHVQKALLEIMMQRKETVF